MALDRVRVPPIEAFRDAESFYATLAHEVTHWTRHPDRLARDFGRKTFGDEGYAREELVAELGAAFLCADLDLTLHVREDHAAYIDHWLGVLKADKRAIFSAAAHTPSAPPITCTASSRTLHPTDQRGRRIGGPLDTTGPDGSPSGSWRASNPV